MTKKLDPKLSKKLTQGTKAKMEQAQQNVNRMYVYPTLSMRQASILIECMKRGLEEGLIVEGEYVSADEWIELTKTLLK